MILQQEKLTIGVVGSSGMAGSMIYHYLKEQGHNVIGYSRTVLRGYTDKILNIHNEADLEGLYFDINAHKMDAVINCIGYLVKDSEKNPAEAIYTNTYFPHRLEEWTRGTGTKVIHLSTDCIFNGDSILPYNEESLPDETNWYGKSKALGEINNKKDLTLRQSIIGPAPQKKNTGLFNWIVTQTEPVVKGYGGVMWNGITTLELAKHIEKILVNNPQLSGIYHLVPESNISKYALLCLIRDIWNLDVTLAKENEPQSFKILENTRADYLSTPPDYEVQLSELYEYMKERNIRIGKV
jgi:dTDP-4-dehydrorhamnose reductase